MNPQVYLAMDFGGGSGRGILGRFDGERLTLEEIHRLDNYFVDVGGLYYWDILRMYRQILEALRLARKETGSLCGIGVDTWGTDYGLLDKNGQLLGNCRCMRGADGRAVEAVERIIPRKELFAKTGIQTIYGNTVFQLYERKLLEDPALLHAERMLMTPDLLAYFLTGEKRAEYTMATTSMLYNPLTREWEQSIMDRLGLPGHILAELIRPGDEIWRVRTALLEETGFGELAYIPVGTHDTASAVSAAPLEAGQAFCSSGTWSLLGVESDRPILTDEAFAMNFSNEGTVDGKIRLLKNIMGMWILQQCREQWAVQGRRPSWDELVAASGKAPAHRSFINLESPEFYSAGGMIRKIQSACQKSSQPVPETVGEIARCVYESMAMRYRLTTDQLAQVTGRPVTALRIVGGGGKNELLNQYVANVTGLPVYVGPVEAAGAGNILTQAMAKGELSGVSELREVVRRSFPTSAYYPQERDRWADAYAHYLAVTGV